MVISRHTNKSREWIRKKYFIRKGCRNWIFGFEYVCGGIKEKFTVQQLTEIPIKRHIKIKCEANPFDPSWDEYFERRKLKSARQRAKEDFIGNKSSKDDYEPI